MSPGTLTRAVAVGLVVVAGLAACSSNDDGGSESGATAAPTSTEAQAPTTTSAGESGTGAIELVVADGEVVGGVQRVAVKLGEEVVLRVTSDVADEVHVHGYDLFEDVAAGSTAEVRFVADIPGVFEVELESAHLKIVELEVAP